MNLNNIYRYMYFSGFKVLITFRKHLRYSNDELECWICWGLLKKVPHGQSLVFLETVYSQERERNLTSILTAVCQSACKAHRDHLFPLDEREAVYMCNKGCSSQIRITVHTQKNQTVLYQFFVYLVQKKIEHLVMHWFTTNVIAVVDRTCTQTEGVYKEQNYDIESEKGKG